MLVLSSGKVGGCNVTRRLRYILMSKEDWVLTDEKILDGKAKTRSKSGEINDPTSEY